MSIGRKITTVMVTLSMLGVALAPIGASAQGMSTKTYEVTITNITTSKQALSPPIIAIHPASAHAWQMGEPASKGLELVAEEGMTDMLAAELRPVSTDVQAAKAHLLPGDSITLKIMAKDGDVLSAATMLVQTNDGFTGLDSVPLAAGDTDAMAYDAGTEENTERKTDVPGPPLGGKNSGPATAPAQPISAHTGIKGTADVTPDFNWTGPVARFTIRMVSAGSGTGTGTSQPTPGTVPAPIPAPEPSPNMPKTGTGDISLWLMMLGAGAMLLSGLSARRFAHARR